MDLHQLLGDETEPLLSYECKGVPREDLVLPGPDFIDRVYSLSDRPVPVLRNLGVLLNTGRLGGTGYISILPVDQGIEHTAAASFSPNPIYFDPKNIIELAIEAGCNAVATTLGVLGVGGSALCPQNPLYRQAQPQRAAHLSDRVRPGHVRLRAAGLRLGAVGVGATVYSGREESRREMQEVAEAFEEAHQLGMFTVLWCYVRNSAFKKDGVNYEVSADLTGQANHLGVTIHADIIKQKLPENNGGFPAIGFGATSKLVYSDYTTDNPIDLARWQVVNNYMGRIPLINSGGASSGAGDMAQAVRTAVINKRAGGAGLIMGRKAFQRPMSEGVAMINAVQDVYADHAITIA